MLRAPRALFASPVRQIDALWRTLAQLDVALWQIETGLALRASLLRALEADWLRAYV
jgi:hypothetical protein